MLEDFAKEWLEKQGEKSLLLEKADENGYKLIRIEKEDYIFEKK